jgi:hypothetical protein
MRDHHIPESNCLNCGKRLNGAGATADEDIRPPRPGDIAVCFDCGHLQIFGENLAFRELTSDEVIEVAGDPDIIRASRIIGEFRKWKEGQHAQASPDNRASRRRDARRG